jgi:hypothetical protein
MRFSIIRTGVVACAAAVALAACAGHGVVPSQNIAPNSDVAPNSDLAPNSAIAPSSDLASGVTPDNALCDIPGQWYFHGACLAFNMSTTKTTIVNLGKFNPYGGIKITATFGPAVNPPKGVSSIRAILGDAIGNGDITGTVGGKTFSPYGKTNNCLSNRKLGPCPGHPFVYAELYNDSTHTLKPKDTPGFAITDSHGFPGKRLCFPAVWSAATKNSPAGWNPNLNVGGVPHGTTVKINPVANPGQLFYTAHQAVITAGACE